MTACRRRPSVPAADRARCRARSAVGEIVGAHAPARLAARAAATRPAHRASRPDVSVLLERDGDWREATRHARRARTAAACVLLGLDGVATATAAEALRGSARARPRAPICPRSDDDEYYHHEVSASPSRRSTGRRSARSRDVMRPALHDVWVVRDGDARAPDPGRRRRRARDRPRRRGGSRIDPLPGLLD